MAVTRRPKTSSVPARPPATVDDFFSALSHPLKSTLSALRTAIRGASRDVREAIKWNAPSFYIGAEQFFATTNIHARGKPDEHVLLILHRGAKTKNGRVAVSDPDALLEWLSPDRAAVRFYSAADFRKKKSALQTAIREWITQL